MHESSPKVVVSFLVLIVGLCTVNGRPAAAETFSNLPNENIAGITVRGPGQSPQLFFACCDQGVPAMEALFANSEVIADLKDLRAGLALAVPDQSAERAQVVRQLNAAGVPLIAWIELPNELGIYFNADDPAQAVAAIVSFETWTRQYGLKWEGVGLDIEPNSTELLQFKQHKWHAVRLLATRYFDLHRVYRAREAYGEMIRHLRAHGYLVQTYQMPLLPADRRVHTTLLERLLGIVDVRGDEEALMLYSSFAPSIGAGMIWEFGPGAQAIAIGTTQVDPKAVPAGIPLHWEEFSRDLIVASHFSHIVGVYNLEGSVQQGFLPLLKTMNWNQSVLIPADSIRKAVRTRRVIDAFLWVGTFFPGIAAVLLLLLMWLVLRWRNRRKRRRNFPAGDSSG